MKKIINSLTKKDIPFGAFVAVVIIAQCLIQGIPVAILTWLILALVTTVWEYKDRKKHAALEKDLDDLAQRIKESAANVERIKNSF
jgi:flagellar biosynthesis component FlhA